MIKGKPFVKWAGGKRQIIDKLKNMFQMSLTHIMNHLLEGEHFYSNFLLKRLL